MEKEKEQAEEKDPWVNEIPPPGGPQGRGGISRNRASERAWSGFDPPDLVRQAAAAAGAKRGEAGMAVTGHPPGGGGTRQCFHQGINNRVGIHREGEEGGEAHRDC